MKHLTNLLLLLLALTLMSCEFESEGVFTDDTTEEYQLYDYYIDQYGNEGIVAYIYSSKTSERKYILVISATEASRAWGPMGEAVYKRDTISRSGLRDPTFGVTMHQSMKSIGIEKFPAQAWCDQMNNGEDYPRAGSWRLPTYNELQLIFGSNGARVSALNSALTGIGATTIDTDHKYWTCVEDHNGYITINGKESDYDKENRAIITSPVNSTYGNKDRWLKKNEYYVRAIKYVYYHD